MLFIRIHAYDNIKLRPPVLNGVRLQYPCLLYTSIRHVGNIHPEGVYELLNKAHCLLITNLFPHLLYQTIMNDIVKEFAKINQQYITFIALVLPVELMEMSAQPLSCKMDALALHLSLIHILRFIRVVDIRIRMVFAAELTICFFYFFI